MACNQDNLMKLVILEFVNTALHQESLAISNWTHKIPVASINKKLIVSF